MKDNKRSSHTFRYVEPLALTSEDAAKLLGISRAHFWKLLAANRLPRPVRMGRAVRWRRDELIAWLDAGCPDYKRWRSMKHATPPVETEPAALAGT